VLTYLGSSSHQVSKWLRDCDTSVAMAEMPEAVALPDRSIRLGVAGGEETLVVRRTKASCLVGPFAVIKRTESAANSQRFFGRNSSSQQP
jgi:hypothetical protein